MSAHTAAPDPAEADTGQVVVRVDAVAAVRGLAAAVAARGEFHVDPGAARLAAPIHAALCQGSDDTSTRPRYSGSRPCLVGQALTRLGVPAEVLAAADREVGRRSRISHVPLPATIEVTDGARLVLAAAQDAQDSAQTWGQALTRACRTAERLGLSDDDVAALTPVLASALPGRPAWRAS